MNFLFVDKLKMDFFFNLILFFLVVDKVKIESFFPKRNSLFFECYPSTHQNPKRDFRQTPLHTYVLLHEHGNTLLFETKMNESW
jgi:hypothetical protein